MNEEEALKKVSAANKQVLLAMGALLLASLNATKAFRYLQEVTHRERTFPSENEAEQVKQEVENMVEAYSENVN